MPRRDLRLSVAQHESELAVAVEDLEPFGCAGQGVFERGAAKPHDGSGLVDGQPLFFEKPQHGRMENLHAAAGQDVHRRFVDLPNLFVREDS